MWLGDFYCIIVNDSDAIKEVLYNSDFDGRPDIFLARLRDPDMERRGEWLSLFVNFQLMFCV